MSRSRRFSSLEDFTPADVDWVNESAPIYEFLAWVNVYGLTQHVEQDK